MNHRSRTRTWLAVACVVAIVLLAAACGGSAAKKDVASAPPGGASATDGAKSGTSLQTGQLAAAPPSGAPSSSSEQYAATDAHAGGASGSGGVALPSQLDRKMIMVATVDLNVDDVSRSFEDVTNIAAGAGGFVSTSSFGHTDDRQTASVTIRVPADKYQDALGRLRKLGDVRGEQSSSDDVTEQYTDLQSRLRNLKATEEQYLGFLGKAGDIGQVLQVQDRLNAVRADIEQVQGRINLVEHQTDLATITVHLDPPVVAKTQPKTSTGSRGPLEVAADSFQASLVVLRGIATAGLAVAAFSWWLAPLAILGWFLGRRQLRTRAP
jgi:hypothetical protein